MDCPNCKTPIDKETKFCPACGKPVKGQAPEETKQLSFFENVKKYLVFRLKLAGIVLLILFLFGLLPYLIRTFISSRSAPLQETAPGITEQTGQEETKPDTATTNANWSCQPIDLAKDYQTYYFYDSQFPCDDYERNVTSDKFQVKCADPVSRWREYYVQELATNGALSLKIKGELALNEYEKFFVESNGIGVKYDDYVDLIVFSADPTPTLEEECNQAYTQETQTQCGLTNTSSNVLTHCGVAKYSSSKTCDFDIATAGLSKIYLVLRVADAWPADVEGVFSNLKICTP